MAALFPATSEVREGLGAARALERESVPALDDVLDDVAGNGRLGSGSARSKRSHTNVRREALSGDLSAEALPEVDPTSSSEVSEAPQTQLGVPTLRRTIISPRGLSSSYLG